MDCCIALSRRLELQCAEAGVKFIAPEQVIVPADGFEPAFVDDGNAAGVLHGGEPVGDDDRGASLHEG